jgi:RES domain
MSCCAHCFGDKYLEEEIFPAIDGEIGCCNFCRTKDTKLIPPIKLQDQFELLVGIYIEDPKGKTLVELLKSEWALFPDDKLDANQSRALLSDILDDGEIVRKKFSSQTLNFDERWQDFRGELMHTNRYFPNTPIDLDQLKELLGHLLINPKDIPVEWFRARIQLDDTIYTHGQMGSPPKHLASHGRANPAGIPYLYLASTTQTAVSEIRPHTGEKITIATVKLNELQKIADLRHPKKTISPFLIGDEEKIKKTRSYISFLEQLGNELTRPVLPRSAAFDYAPSQYLCEFIKKCNFTGVMYNSSVGDGFNLAIFKPDSASVINLIQQTVSKVSVTIID